MRIAIACLAAALLALAAATAYARVVAPRDGATYKGATAEHRQLSFVVSGRSIQIIAFGFDCGAASAKTSLQDIKLKRGKSVYSFSTRSFANVTYSDDHPDENAAINIAGTFNRTARRVTGTLRVKTPRCHDSGSVNWHAKR
jgi:hypothetical protein